MATVTLNAATDWSTSASEAITAAKTAAGEGGTVIVPEGTYRITEPIYPLAGQRFVGAGIDASILRLDFAAVPTAFEHGAIFDKTDPGGVNTNPGVSIIGFTLDGGRSQCGRPSALSKEDPLGYGEDCPYGAGGGVSLGVSWLLSKCRLTNINGPKTGCFGAHDSRIEYCVWDNDGGGTGGVEDNVGGGGCTFLELIGNLVKANAAGSGFDITTGGFLRMEGNKILYRSLILEGIQRAVIRNNVIGHDSPTPDAGSINIKSNTAYASAQDSGAWCTTEVLVEGNTVINSYSPGIVVSSTWDDKGPGDALDGGRYGQARGVVVRNNLIISPLGLGIYVGGQNRARASRHALVHSNTIIDPRAGTAGLGNEWNSGSGHFACAGVGIGSGDGVVVTDNVVIRTSSSADASSAVVNGARGGSQTAANTHLARNTVVTMADV